MKTLIIIAVLISGAAYGQDSNAWARAEEQRQI
jgi:hypothetical protein